MPRDAHVAGILVGMFLALAGGQASAVPPAKTPGKSIEGELLVWSGGKTRAEAESQREGLTAYLDALKPVLKVKAEVMESARVEGLKPGFFVVALGVCPKDKVDEPLGVFQAIYPDVYTRTVKYSPTGETPALECPEMETVTTNSADEPVLWGLEKDERVAQGGSTLVGLAFTYSWEEAGDFASSYFTVKTIYLLTENKTRRLVDSKLYDGPSDATTLESLESKDGRLVSSVKYGDPRCSPSTDAFMGWRAEVKASIGKSQIKLVKSTPRLIDEGSCGYAEESRMVSGEDRPEGQ
jgi:hypothetical protein